jgi:hypothetical protein
MPALVGMLAASLCTVSAHAQDPANARAPWELSVTPYVWGTAMKGDAGLGRINGEVDASFSDILKNSRTAATPSTGT